MQHDAHIVRDILIYITGFIKHHLQLNGFHKLIMWSDGCSGQHTSKLAPLFFTAESVTVAFNLKFKSKRVTACHPKAWDGEMALPTSTKSFSDSCFQIKEGNFMSSYVVQNFEQRCPSQRHGLETRRDDPANHQHKESASYVSSVPALPCLRSLHPPLIQLLSLSAGKHFLTSARIQWQPLHPLQTCTGLL